MADPQTQQQEKEKMQPGTAEKAPVATELTEKKEEKEQKEEAAHEESVKKRTGTKLEVLETSDVYAPDTETPDSIAAIEAQKLKEKEEIESSLELIGTVAVTILAKLFEGGFTSEDMDTPEEFRAVMQKVQSDPEYSELKKKLSTLSEKAAWKKLHETIEQPNTPLYKRLKEKWREFVKKSKEVYEDAEKGTLSKSWEWVKKNPGKTALLVAGAFALYKILFSKKEEDEKKEAGEKGEKSWTDRIFSKKGMLALGVLTIGALVGGAKLRDLLKEGLKDEAKEKAERALNSAKEASLNWVNKRIRFDETKDRLVKALPAAPSWLKTAQLRNVADDIGLDPEKTDTWKEYEGKGGAALLLYHWMSRKRKLDGATQKLIEKFVEDEKNRPEEGPSEVAEGQEQLKEYGEFIPVKEAWKNYKNDLESALSGLYAWAVENKEMVAAAGIFLASFEGVRSAIGSAGKATFEGFIGLAKVPFRTVKNFPLSSLFVVSAALVAADQFSVKDRAGNVMVPKDPENLKKYAKQKLADAGDWAHELPHVPHEEIDKAVEIMTTPGLLKEYVGPAAEMIEDVGVAALEMVTLKPEELIRKTNDKGLHVFYVDLRPYMNETAEDSDEHEHYRQLLEEIKTLRQKVKGGALLKNQDILDRLNVLGEPIGITVLVHDGYLAWIKKSMNSDVPLIEKGPKNFMVDPSLERDEAVSMAQRFVSEDTVWNAMGRTVGVPIEDFRMLADKMLFQNVKSAKEAAEVIEKKLGSGAYIVTYGGMVFLYEATTVGGKAVEGAVQRYALGPINVFKHIGKALTGDFSVTEAAVDYAGGLLPVMIFGATANMLRGNFRKVFSRKLIAESLAYPATGLWDFAVFTKRYVVPALRGKKTMREIIENPKIKIESDFFASVNRWRFHRAAFHRGPMSGMLRGEYQNLARLYEAKLLWHQAEFKGTLSQEGFQKQLHEVIKNVDKFELAGRTVTEFDDKSLITKIEADIELREKFVRKADELAKLQKAMERVESGKPKRAEKILTELGYDPAISTNKAELEARIQSVKNDLKTLDISINPTKGADPERVKAIEAAEASTKPLTTEEKIKIVDTMKGLEGDIQEIQKMKQQAIDDLNNKVAAEGKPLTDPEIQTQRQKIEAEFETKIVDTYDKWSAHAGQLDNATLKQHGIEPERMLKEKFELDAKMRPTAKGGRLKKVGRGLGAAVLGFLAAFGVSKGIEYIKGSDEVLDLEKVYGKETPEQEEAREEGKKKIAENPEFHKDIMFQIDAYFKSIDSSYNEIFELLNPNKLKDTSDDALTEVVDRTVKVHEENVEKMKKFVGANREAIDLFYQRYPDQRKEKEIGRFFALGYDEEEKRPYLKYSDDGDFKAAVYDSADFIREHMEKLLKGEQIDWGDSAADIGKEICPFWGTYRDGARMVDAFERGQIGRAFGSMAWMAVGGIGDVLLVLTPFTAGVSGVIGGAIKAGRGAVGVGKGVAKGGKAAAMVEKFLKLTKHVGKIQLAMMGADVGRALVTPEHSEKYVF